MTPITGRKMRRYFHYSLASGVVGAAWFTVTNPKEIVLPLLFKNYLGGTAGELGTLLGVVQFLSIFQLFSVFFWDRFRRRKLAWTIPTVILRFQSFFIAWACFAIAGGATPRSVLPVVTVAVIITAVFSGLASPGWFTWMKEIYQEETMTFFFVRRSICVQMTNILSFLLITLALDALPEKVFSVFGVMYVLAGFFGLAGVGYHLLLPDTQRPFDHNRSKGGWMLPLKNRNFIVLSLIVGLTTACAYIASPFTAIYVSDAEGLNISKVWLGIMTLITQGAWILSAGFWGEVMERLGRKPVVFMGGFFTLSWLGYVALSRENYIWILPIIALIRGLLSPGFWEGGVQLMLSIVPKRELTSYVGWYWTFMGIAAGLGATGGGFLMEALTKKEALYWGRFNGEQIVFALAALGGTCSLLFYRFIRAPSEKTIGEAFGIVAHPGIFRVYLFIGVIGKPTRSRNVEKALRLLDGSSGNLAVSEVIDRLDDPEQEVREEATRTLGRMRSPEGIEALVKRVEDSSSPLRIFSARALGQAGALEAVPTLIKGLQSRSKYMQEACASALGRIDERKSIGDLLALMRGSTEEKVLAAAASALSKKGATEAGEEICRYMLQAKTNILRRQLSIALANLLGTPGEFYGYITGGHLSHDKEVEKLFARVRRRLSRLTKKSDLQERKKVVRKLFPRLDRTFEERNFKEFQETLEILMESLKKVSSPSTEESRERLALGRRFIEHLANQENRPGEIEHLLVLYFLSHYPA